MNRMTSDNVFEMDMTQRAMNQVRIGKDGWTQYVERPDQEYSVCDLIRTSAETLGVELPILSDEALSGLLLDWLQYSVEEPEGVLAILYRALYAMAALRAKLYRYEDTGLEPEDVDALQKRERGLAEMLVNISCGCAVSYSRLAELAQAEKDGRLEILPPNDPLTLEELREMGQKCEAVYVAHTDGLPVFRDQKYCAAALDFSPAFGSTAMHVHAIYGDRLTMWEDEYGKTWLAYRHKKEEGTT